MQHGIFGVVPLSHQGIGKDVPRAQHTPSWEIPMAKPYIRWVFVGKFSPRIPREHNKYHGYNTVIFTPLKVNIEN